MREIVWCLICLALFMILGPFSVGAVAIGIWTLSKNRENMKEPESIGE